MTRLTIEYYQRLADSCVKEGLHRGEAGFNESAHALITMMSRATGVATLANILTELDNEPE